MTVGAAKGSASTPAHVSSEATSMNTKPSSTARLAASATIGRGEKEGLWDLLVVFVLRTSPSCSLDSLFVLSYPQGGPGAVLRPAHEPSQPTGTGRPPKTFTHELALPPRPAPLQATSPAALGSAHRSRGARQR